MANNNQAATSAALGKSAEVKARRYLEAKGLKVIEANKRTAGGELDLVAWDGEVLVFIEVKARSHSRFGRPEEAVDQRKQNRLISAAGAFLAEMAGTVPVCRFDVITVDLGEKDREVHHLVDAFRPGD